MTVSNLIAEIVKVRPGFVGDGGEVVDAELLDEVSYVHAQSLHNAEKLSTPYLYTPNIAPETAQKLDSGMDKHHYRKLWLIRFRKQMGSVSALAEKLGVEPNYISSILGKKALRNVGDDVARRMEQKFELPEGTVDLPSVAIRQLIAVCEGLDDAAIQEVIAVVKFKKLEKKLKNSAKEKV